MRSNAYEPAVATTVPVVAHRERAVGREEVRGVLVGLVVGGAAEAGLDCQQEVDELVVAHGAGSRFATSREPATRGVVRYP